MIAIRKAWWATALLAAFAGCNSEEPTGEVPPPPAAPSGPAAGEGAPAAAPEKKDEMPAAKDEAAAPKPDDAAKKEAEATPPAAEAPKKDEAPADKKDEAAAEKKTAAKKTKTPGAKELAAINELPADEKSVALKQILCPVSGGLLGAMGKPVKVSAEGKTFFLCCDSCSEEVTDHPKDVVAKLNSK